MNKFINGIYKNQALIYKVFLFLLTAVLIVYLFPKGNKFKYELAKGKPWQYETLYAPFDFSILKTNDEIKKEKSNIKKNHSPYFDYNREIAKESKTDLDEKIDETFNDSIMNADGVELVKFSKRVLNEVYDKGVVEANNTYDNSQIIFLKKGDEAREMVFKNLIRASELGDYLGDKIEGAGLEHYSSELREVLLSTIEPNITLDEELTDKELESQLNNISYTKGIVSKGTRIIGKGEVMNDRKLQVLRSLRAEYQNDFWNSNKYEVVIIGYAFLVSLALFMLFLFMKKFDKDVFESNTQVSFVFFNIFLVVLMTVGVMKMDVDYIYAAPICLLPLTLKTFFDTRLGFFVHVITVLILGFVVPNSFEYMFLQIIAGIVTMLTVSELYKRANLFISIGQITLVYVFAYFAFTVIQEGNFSGIEWLTVLMFIINGVLLLFVQPLIYAYEKIFGLVSDMSLLELSNTNSKLMKKLSNKAPGTFHHSLNVANLAEASANEVGANAMLVRVAALHHDIGKITAPTYFTENQTSSVNPHDDLEPRESARIIINHVIHGIEMAKRNKLPDRIIDFIRTHHGTTTVYYFYKKAKKEAEGNEEEVDIKNYQYPGPTPFSKETAILMMSDSVEAASKSLKEPTSNLIDDLVEKIINKQMENYQFLNASITFKEIQMVKKILKRKLNNIYHLRVEYPE